MNRRRINDDKEKRHFILHSLLAPFDASHYSQNSREQDYHNEVPKQGFVWKSAWNIRPPDRKVSFTDFGECKLSLNYTSKFIIVKIFCGLDVRNCQSFYSYQGGFQEWKEKHQSTNNILLYLF